MDRDQKDHKTITPIKEDATAVVSLGEPEKADFLGLESLRTDEQALEDHLNVTEDDLAEAKVLAQVMTLEGVRKMMSTVLKIHDRDPNFPHVTLTKIKEFLANEAVCLNPDDHRDLIYEMKLEAALITNNSPYAEVRAVVDNKDDAAQPCSTIRAWTIGIIFSLIMSSINQLFSIRMPEIGIESNVAQLLAFPLGKAWERWMPNPEFKLFGTTVGLNPGPFNKKEHMLIAIMANTAKKGPYTMNIVWAQVLPGFFNQAWARSFWYQILLALSTNFIGYGLAGLVRRFLVYPSYCVWPASLVTIALNSALHTDRNVPVPGPFKRFYSISRYKFFLLAFGAMFIYFWLPNYLFESLSFFSWMTWIAPDNFKLDLLTGFKTTGLLNPWPTFDWNVLLYDDQDPLMVPAFTTFNKAGGMFLAGLVMLALYLTNTWNTGYLPINTNKVWDHFGQRYNVSRAVDERGMFDGPKYMDYSAAYLSAAQIVCYGAFYAMYTCALTHAALFHRHEILMGFRAMGSSARRFLRRGTTAAAPGEDEGGAAVEQEGEYKDVHNRLMASYQEVPHWWYLLTLLVAAVFGFVGIAAWPTYTTPAVVLYGLALALVFIIPVGIIKAMTGVDVTLNVIAEFIGGMWVEGNALAMNFFKSFGYVTCAHTISFTNDLKVAHYLKIPPRVTFSAQMIATLISTFVCVGVMNYQINIPDVCTPEAPMRFVCPGTNVFFTASVLWGTIGPARAFGHRGQYAMLLLGFPLGAAATLLLWLAVRRFPDSRPLRQLHPVTLFYGATTWAPYSFSYAAPGIPVAWLSWIYVRGRYLSFWSKYNFVLSASFSAGLALSAVALFFTVGWFNIELDWWGNRQPDVGCQGTPCRLLDLAEGERFYPWWSSSDAPAP